jgi:putative sigma-54 modulation protein
MQMNITFRHFDASDSLKEHARERVERVNKYLDGAGDAHVVLSVERHVHSADITVHAGSFVLRGKDKSSDMYVSIDTAMEKIERQLKRYKEKLKNHHGKKFVHHGEAALNPVRVRHNVVSFNPEEAETASNSPRIIKTNELIAQPMTVDEAVMQMDLLNNDFLVFTNRKTDLMNVVYRRNDGHYGLIEASKDSRPEAQSA